MIASHFVPLPFPVLDLDPRGGQSPRSAQQPLRSSQISPPSFRGSGPSDLSEQQGTGLSSCRSKRARTDGMDAEPIRAVPPLVLMTLPSPGLRYSADVCSSERKGDGFGPGRDQPPEPGEVSKWASSLHDASPSSGIGCGFDRGSGGSSTGGEEGPAGPSFRPIQLVPDFPDRAVQGESLRAKVWCGSWLMGGGLLGGGLMGGGDGNNKSRFLAMTTDKPLVHQHGGGGGGGKTGSYDTVLSGDIPQSEISALYRLANGPGNSSSYSNSKHITGSEAVSRTEGVLPAQQPRAKRQAQAQGPLMVKPCCPSSFISAAQPYCSKGSVPRAMRSPR